MTASLLPLLPRRAYAAGASKGVDTVIFDQRFPKARDFAQQVAQAGLNPVAIQGDITDLYFHDLASRWNHGPTTMVGLSTKASLFCLEMLARDRGMRLVYAADVPDAEPVPDIPFHTADRKSTTFSIIGEDPEELVVWVIAPRGPYNRTRGGI